MLSQIVSNLGGSVISHAFKSALSILPSFSALAYFGFKQQSAISINEESVPKKNDKNVELTEDDKLFNKIIKDLYSADENVFKSALENFYNFTQRVDLPTLKSQFLNGVLVNNSLVQDQEFIDSLTDIFYENLPKIPLEIFKVKFLEFIPPTLLKNKELLIEKLQENIDTIPAEFSQYKSKLGNALKNTNLPSADSDDAKNGGNLAYAMVPFFIIVGLCCLSCMIIECHERFRSNRVDHRDDDEFNTSFSASSGSMVTQEQFFESMSNLLERISRTRNGRSALAMSSEQFSNSQIEDTLSDNGVLAGQITNNTPSIRDRAHNLLHQGSDISTSQISQMHFDSFSESPNMVRQGGDNSVHSDSLSGSQRRLLREGSDSSSFDLRTPSASFMIRQGEEIEADLGNLSGGSQVQLIQR